MMRKINSKYLIIFILCLCFGTFLFGCENTNAIGGTVEISNANYKDSRQGYNNGNPYACENGSGGTVYHSTQFRITWEDGSSGYYECATKCAQVYTGKIDTTPCQDIISVGGYQSMSKESCSTSTGPDPGGGTDTCTNQNRLSVFPFTTDGKKLTKQGEKPASATVWWGEWIFNEYDQGSSCSGDNLTVEARDLTSEGYTFVEWADGSTSKTYSKFVTWNGEAIIAYYKKPARWYLTRYQKDYHSGAELGSKTEGPYEDGAWASIDAGSVSGYTFKEWLGGVSGHTMDSDKTTTALFVKNYKLTIDQGPNTSIVVRRNSSLIGSTGILQNGDTIYHGDNLTFSYSKDSCFNWASHTVNGASVNSGYGFDVTGDVTVATRANVRQWTLTVNRAAGTGITVGRSSSPYAKATTGNLYSQSNTSANNATTTIYCGDVLNAAYSLNTGYSWGNYSWSGANKFGYQFYSQNTSRAVGSNINSTGPPNPADHANQAVNGHTVDGNVTVKTQSVRDYFEGYAAATVASGLPNTTNNGANINTGYVNRNKEAGTLQLECANEGCNVRFDSYIKTTQGTGATNYYILRKINNGNYTYRKTLANVSPSNSGVSVGSFTDTLYPGQTYCYRLYFWPRGALANDNYQYAQVCASAKVSNFQGKVDSNGVNTGWRDGNYTGYRNISNCSAKTGCKVSFNTALRRTAGIGTSTGYVVSRSSNYWASVRGINVGAPASGSLASGNFRPSNDLSQNNVEKTITRSGEWTLFPGVAVCESIKFKPNNNVVTVAAPVTITLCDLALGEAQPPAPSNPDTPNPDKPDGDETISPALLNIKVKNADVAKYRNYQTEVYAKPGDHLTYRATYNPILQYTVALVPHRICIDGTITAASVCQGATIYPTNGVNSTLKLNALYNNNRGSSRSNWNNSFHVFASGFNFSSNYIGTPGNVTLRKETNPHTVSYTEAGTSLNETARTNHTNAVKTTPRQVTFGNINNNNVGNINTTITESSTYARIPYNFITDSHIQNRPNEEDIVFAGEETTIPYTIEVKPKPNSLTTNNSSETYATPAPVSHKVIVYVPRANTPVTGTPNYPASGTGSINQNLCAYYGLPNDELNCGYTTQKGYYQEGTTERTKLNDGGNFNMNGHVHSNISATFYVQDLKAGSRICVAVASYPSTSGADNNYNNPDGDKKWNISDSKCYTIAKKPSMQIWGGNIFSSTPIDTYTSIKNNLAGYNTGYTVAKPNNYNYIFGSWGETGVTSTATIKGFASGAGTGFAANISGSLWPGSHPNNRQGNNNSPNYATYGPGGSKEQYGSATTLCRRSTLTFANYVCNPGSGLGAIGSAVSTSNAASDKESIISKLVFGNTAADVNETGAVTLNNPGRIKEGYIYYYYGGENDLTVPATSAPVSTGTLQVVHSKKNITITNNIEYAGPYVTLDDIPKLIIYGNNITIACNVSRIDALLIAEQSVKTCDSDNHNAPANSNQLVINGGIIADKLIPNRTYGAATGANSIIPAEIINYDPTLYLWGGDRDQSDDDENQNDSLDTTYFHEVSPRY